LIGSGRTEILQTIFGLLPIEQGTMQLDGEPLAARRPADAIRHGVALVPEDRHLQGLVLDHSIERNLTLPRLPQFSRGGWLRAKAAAQQARTAMKQLSVKAPDASTQVKFLSGGNQQKVVFAKWIEAAPSLLVLDDPTRGIDIGAKREMHRIMRRLAQSGRVVLFYSSDPGEIVAVSDRVIVFVDGVLSQELDGETLTEHELVTAMNTGVKPSARPAA
jgi:ribose transport system ATP-binding protein